ncbi:MAG: hypothetical protein WBD04_07560 [Candidatus Omnitrophota bacterium]
MGQVTRRAIVAVLTMVFFVGITPAFGQGSKSVRYRRLMRDLDREYREGSLTRTEYIQRKREVNSLYDVKPRKKAKPRKRPR